jgi:hypothetical protein
LPSISPHKRETWLQDRAAIVYVGNGAWRISLDEELGDPFCRDVLKKPKRLLDKYAAYTVVKGRGSAALRGGAPLRS